MPKSVLDDVKPGTKLTEIQSKALGKMIAEVMESVGDRRKGILLVHDSLQNTIGIFFQLFSWAVEYEVRFERGDWDPERMVFDIVATKGKRDLVVEVKDVVTPRELGQIWGYVKALQLSGEKARVYLGTDILNYGDLLQGTVGAIVMELMAKEDMGVVVADKYLLVLFHNYSQLTLGEMPEFWVSEDKVG